MVFVDALIKLLGWRETERPEPLDWLYFTLWALTHLYLLLVAVFYFARLADFFPQGVMFFDSFDEPYLGAVATYTILKEVRKKRGVRRRYHGGIFVVYWLILFLVAAVAAWRYPLYRFDGMLHIMLTNALAPSIIWIGSFIHKP